MKLTKIKLDNKNRMLRIGFGLNKGNKNTSSLYYQRFFFPGKTTLPWQTDNTLAVTQTKSTTRLDMTRNGGSNNAY